MHLAFLVVSCLCATVSGSFKEGDFIPTARKVQVSQLRTNWQDLLGQHCPRFALDTTAWMQLPRPKKFVGAAQEYKIQLAFNGEQHITPWLLVYGKHAPDLPMVDVEIVRSGEDIRHINAQVVPLPEEFEGIRLGLEQSFRNASLWPKEMMVHYHFTDLNDVDINRGLYVVYILGLAITLVVAFNAVRGYRTKLLQFFQDTVGADEGVGVAARPAWSGPKAE